MTRSQQAEQTIGRYRKDLGMDRRYRMARMARTRLEEWPAQRAHRAPEPRSFMGIEIGSPYVAAEIIAGTLVFGGSLVGFMFSIGRSEAGTLWSLGAIGVGLMVEGLRKMGVFGR